MPKLDLFQEALAYDGGAPIESTLLGCDFNIRRDFTAEDVHDYMAIFTQTDEDQPMPSIREQIERQLLALTDLSKGKKLDGLVEKIMKYSVSEISKILVTLGKYAGLRDAEGNFLPTHDFSQTMPNSSTPS